MAAGRWESRAVCGISKPAFWAGVFSSAVFASRIQQDLDRCGVSLRDLVWQTDNGGEFKGDFPRTLYFNLVRPNSQKQFLSPWQIIEQLALRSPLQLCLLLPVFLDYHLSDSGRYDVVRLPSNIVISCVPILLAPILGSRLQRFILPQPRV